MLIEAKVQATNKASLDVKRSNPTQYIKVLATRSQKYYRTISKVEEAIFQKYKKLMDKEFT